MMDSPLEICYLTKEDCSPYMPPKIACNIFVD